MSLHNGLDMVAIATIGIYSKTYGSANKDNIASLYSTFGYLEDAPGLAFFRSFYTRIRDCVIKNITIGNI